MTHLPEILPGHWASAAGHAMAQRYATMTRDQLAGGSMSDMEAAYHVAMIMRSDLDHEARLDVGKDRIRWLSVQLALREMQLAKAMELLQAGKALAGDLIEIATTPPPLRIGVRLEGGMVESIYSDQPLPHVQVAVIDYDVDGADGDDLFDVRQTDGPDPSWSMASVNVCDVQHVTNLDWSTNFRDVDTEEPVDLFERGLIEDEG